MKAGVYVIQETAKTHYKLLLPILEVGIFDQSYRIRQASVALLGSCGWL